MDDCPSRRSVLATTGALALAGLAGCTSGDSNADAPTDTATTEPTSDQTTTSSTTAETVSDGDDTTDAVMEDVEPVDWDEVSAFRTWLTDYSMIPEGNDRFDYQAVDLNRVVGTGRAGFLDLDVEAVDGFLVDSGNVVYPGSFDVDRLTDAVESSDAHELTGEYEGYVTAAATEHGTEFALGDDAVLAGSDLSKWIDAHLGDRNRLEEVDPVFTYLFRRLPDRGLLTAQYGPPAGGEISTEAIYAWGHSMASLDADDATWVYVLEDAATEDVVDELETGLEESVFTKSVTDVAVGGRIVTVTATPASMS